MKKRQEGGQRFMSTVKLGPKGQIVIPKEVREMFELEPGDSMLLLADPDRGIALQRQSLMIKIADAIFNGGGKAAYPQETESDLQAFAQTIQEVCQEEEKTP